MTDYQVNLNQDWEDFCEEVKALLDENPELSVIELEDITGGDYEDVLWAYKKWEMLK